VLTSIGESIFSTDTLALAGFAALVVGIGMMSIPWALIVGGTTALGLAVFGELRKPTGQRRTAE